MKIGLFATPLVEIYLALFDVCGIPLLTTKTRIGYEIHSKVVSGSCNFVLADQEDGIASTGVLSVTLKC